MPVYSLLYIGAVGANQTVPSPLNAFKNPSPFIADPNKLLSDLVTLNETPLVLAIAKFPSTLSSSPFVNSYDTISLSGTSSSNITTPVPISWIWKTPSPPNKADDTFFWVATFISISAEQQKNKPLSTIIESLSNSNTK